MSRTSNFIVAAAFLCAAQAQARAETVIVDHVAGGTAEGLVIETMINVFVGECPTSPVHVYFRSFDDQGNQASYLSLRDLPADEVVVPASEYGRASAVTFPQEGRWNVGWAEVQCDCPILAEAVYRISDSSGTITLTDVNVGKESATMVAMADVSADHTNVTAISMVYPGNGDPRPPSGIVGPTDPSDWTLVELYLIDHSGELVDTSDLVLSAGQKAAYNLFEMFDVNHAFEGSVVVLSERPISLTVLQQDHVQLYSRSVWTPEEE